MPMGNGTSRRSGLVRCGRILVYDKMSHVDLRYLGAVAGCWPRADVYTKASREVSRALQGCAVIAAAVTASFYQNTVLPSSKTYALLKTSPAHHEMHINDHVCSVFTVSRNADVEIV